MGRELVARLLADGTHDVKVWNRTPDKAAPCVALGAVLAPSVDEAVSGAELMITCLFGPQAVRDVVLDADLPWAPSAIWMDITTVGPAVARECAAWAGERGVAYVQAPVLGSLGPARAGQLGVLIGGDDAAARAVVRSVVSLWADADRVVEYEEAGQAAVGKLLVNYGLAVGMQGLIEACRIGEAGGLTPAQAVALAQLPRTPLSVIAGMKGAALLGGDYTDTQFSTNLLAKDVDLMLATVAPLPALQAADVTLKAAVAKGHGEDDFAAMVDAA